MALIYYFKKTIYNVNIIKMSWLNNIYKSIINEISAEDAYKRFYGSIPREDYDRILNGDPAPDRFMQFILNCVRDNKSTADDAVEVISQYKPLPSDAKQKIQMAVKSNDFQNLDDLLACIKNLASGGSFISRKQFAKKGLITVLETDDEIVTCTTNYQANNHYFGKTHWCTASDREGKYDGYEMFRRYSMNRDSILLQFRSKKKTLPIQKDADGDIIYANEYGSYPNEEEVRENAIRYDYHLIQVAVNDEGITTEICDFFDHRVSYNRLCEIVGDAIKVLTNEKMFNFLFETQEEQHVVEDEYEKEHTKIIEKRQEEKRRKLREKIVLIQTEVDSKNADLFREARKKWGEFVDNKLYNNLEILARIKEYYQNNEITNLPEVVDECYNAGTANQLGNSFILTPVVVFYSIKEVEDNNGYTVDFEVSRDEWVSQLPVTDSMRGQIVVITDGEKVLFSNVYKVNDENPYSYITSPTITGQEQNGSEYQYVVVDNNLISLVDLKTNSIIETEGDEFANIKPALSYKNYCDRYVAFYNYYGDGIMVLDKSTQRLYKNAEKNAQKYDINHPFRIVEESEKGILLKKIRNGLFNFIVEDKTFLVNVPGINLINARPPFDHRIEGFILMDDIGRTNIGLTEGLTDGETMPILFGIWGRGLFEGGNGPSIQIIDKLRKKEQFIFYNLAEDKFYIRADGGGFIECDKYGQTEKDRIAAKNFRDWQGKGGYSPEVLAQMEKMWNDRDDEMHPKNAAFNAWNDDDRGLDALGNNVKYDKNFGFNTAMQKFDDDDRWGGYIGTKDPEGYSRDMADAVDTMSRKDSGIQRLANGEIPDGVRKNPWYRIDRQGRPLDQPWYDEDEIPARLSDRVVRENKIIKEYNNLQSIMRRMGLIED